MLRTLLTVLIYLLVSVVLYAFCTEFRFRYLSENVSSDDEEEDAQTPRSKRKKQSKSNGGDLEKTDPPNDDKPEEEAASDNNESEEEAPSDNDESKEEAPSDDSESKEEASSDKQAPKSAPSRRSFRSWIDGFKTALAVSRGFSIASAVLFFAAAVLLGIFGPDKLNSEVSVGQSLVIAEVTLIIAAIDFSLKKIPNKLIVVLLAVRAAGIAAEICIEPSAWLEILLRSAIGFFIGGMLMFICMFLSRGGVGAGDIKLYAAIGMYFGFAGVLEIMLYSLLLAALFSIGLLISKKAKIKSTIPMAPFIALGLSVYLFFIYA